MHLKILSTRVRAFALAMLCVTLVAVAKAQAEEPKAAAAEPTAAELQAQILEMQKQILRMEQQSLQELRRIRALLQRQAQQQQAAWPTPKPPPPAKPVTVSVSASPTLGTESAPVTIVEFTDYECGFCARFATTIFPQLKAKYVDTGKLRFVSRELPLAMHKHAFKAAVASHCAANQDRFWEMRDLLFRNQKQLEPDSLTVYAQTLDMDYAAFAECFEADQPKALIDRDMADAGKAGIRGTPTFVLGPTEPGKTTITGNLIVGAKPYTAFAAQIDALLAKTNAAKPKAQAPAPSAASAGPSGT